MNYIEKLQKENAALRNALVSANDRVTDLLVYYASTKFQEHDYAHVSTDVYPRLIELRKLVE